MTQATFKPSVKLTTNYSKHPDDQFNWSTQWWIPLVSFLVGLAVVMLATFGLNHHLSGTPSFWTVLLYPFLFIWKAIVWIVKGVGQGTMWTSKQVFAPVADITGATINVVGIRADPIGANVDVV